MSVFTPVTTDDLRSFLANYSLGELCTLSGIQAGVENSNFLVQTTQGQYILTLFEQHDAATLPYFLQLMQFFAQAGIPTAHPIPDRQGQLLRQLNARPAAVIEHLAGETLTQANQPNVAQCTVIGQTLARIHCIGQDFPYERPPDRGHHWRMHTAQRLLPALNSEQQALLRNEIKQQQQIPFSTLPAGVIHADLFCDNVLFVGDQLQGVIDWYYACNDCWLYDLAVVVNDWCCHPNGALDEQRLRPLLQAYHQERPLQALECTHWAGMLRAAALRFWLSRLQDKLEPREGAMILQKDPDEFRLRLQQRQTETTLIRACWPDTL